MRGGISFCKFSRDRQGGPHRANRRRHPQGLHHRFNGFMDDTEKSAPSAVSVIQTMESGVCGLPDSTTEKFTRGVKAKHCPTMRMSGISSARPTGLFFSGNRLITQMDSLSSWCGERPRKRANGALQPTAYRLWTARELLSYRTG